MLALASTAPLEEVTGAEASYAPVYGRVEPAPCLAARVESDCPVTIATFIPASREWLPTAIRKTLEPDTYEVLTGQAVLTVAAGVGQNPVVSIAPSLPPATEYRTVREHRIPSTEHRVTDNAHVRHCRICRRVTFHDAPTGSGFRAGPPDVRSHPASRAGR